MAGRAILWGNMWVCQCCMLSDANGECCPDDQHGGDGIAPWSDVDFSRFSVTMGLLAEEHHEECPVRITGDHNAVECDCERREFSTSRCDGCGSRLHGDRYAFALWRKRQSFRSGYRAHGARANGGPTAKQIDDYWSERFGYFRSVGMSNDYARSCATLSVQTDFGRKVTESLEWTVPRV